MMKRWGCAAAALLCVFSLSWAQKNPVKAGRELSGAVERVTKRQLLNQVPKRMQNLYGYSVRELINTNRLPLKGYSSLAVYNDVLVSRALDGFVHRAALFEKHAAALSSQIDSRVYDEVPYAEFLPQDVDVLYLGEIHGVTFVQQEIKTIVKSLRRLYPGRNIYLAAESVPVASGTFAMEDLIYTPQDLERRLRGFEQAAELEEPEVLASFAVIQAALEENIPVLGLENEDLLLDLAAPEGRLYPTAQQYERMVTSLAGMEMRNRQFAKGIKMLRAADPSALVVVYGGIDHFAYHQPSSVPAKVKGKSFVVQVSVPAALPGANPLFVHFKEHDEIRRAFNESPNKKLAEFWKKPSSFKKLLGNDLTVIVHE